MKRIPLVIILWIAAALTLKAQTPVDQSKTVKPDGRISIEDVSGSITVTGWDRPEVQVKGTLGKNTEPLVFSVSDGTTRIEVHPKQNSGSGGDGVLTIQVPKQSRVEVDTVSADILAKDLQGTAKLETVSGSVTASAMGGEVSLESVSGTVKVDAGSREAHCETVSGTIQASGQSPTRLSLKSVSGAIHYEGGLARTGEMRAETVSGSVELKMAAGVSAEFDTSTFSGNISSDLDAPLNLKKDGPVGKSANFRTGGGDGRVKVETFSGSVRFVKK